MDSESKHLEADPDDVRPVTPGVSQSGGGGSSGNMADKLAGDSNRGGRFDIAKLLDAVIKYNGSDIHLRVNRPPVIRVRGELRDLGKTLLTPDDTMSLMKSVASERNQTELGERGGSDFGFA